MQKNWSRLVVRALTSREYGRGISECVCVCACDYRITSSLEGSSGLLS